MARPSKCVRRVHKSSADEFENFVDENNRRREDHNPSPIVLRERDDAEDLVADGHVEDDEVDGDGHGASDDQPRVLPRRHRDERAVLGERVESIKHLDHHEHGERP